MGYNHILYDKGNGNYVLADENTLFGPYISIEDRYLINGAYKKSAFRLYKEIMHIVNPFRKICEFTKYTYQLYWCWSYCDRVNRFFRDKDIDR